MKKRVDINQIKQFKPMRKAMNFQEAIIESNRCLLCEDAPCSQACPAGTDPGKFIRQIKFQNYKGAARTIRNNNIMGSSCAHICPTEKLCELGCSAKELNHTIDISGLQQFAINYGIENKLEPMIKSKENMGKIAVIGAGPAGLSCASELAKLDYDVTIYEKDSEAGGVLRWNIPNFRLPVEMIENDLKNIRDLGVKIKCNEDINTKEKANKLLKNNDAVFLATGLNKAFLLSELKDFNNSKSYIDFLRSIQESKKEIKAQIENKIVTIVGGGSVALDCAISAKALGAKRVYVISLEHLSELPAVLEEVELGHLMNIIFKPNTRITSVKSIDNNIIAVKGNEIDWKEENNFSPKNAIEIEDTEFTLKTDLVIQAIGTYPIIKEVFSELETFGKGCIVSKNSLTSHKKIFVAGDLVNGGATAVQAVGEGKKAAIAIDSFVKGGK